MGEPTASRSVFCGFPVGAKTPLPQRPRGQLAPQSAKKRPFAQANMPKDAATLLSGATNARPGVRIPGLPEKKCSTKRPRPWFGKKKMVDRGVVARVWGKKRPRPQRLLGHLARKKWRCAALGGRLGGRKGRVTMGLAGLKSRALRIAAAWGRLGGRSVPAARRILPRTPRLAYGAAVSNRFGTTQFQSSWSVYVDFCIVTCGGFGGVCVRFRGLGC